MRLQANPKASYEQLEQCWTQLTPDTPGFYDALTQGDFCKKSSLPVSLDSILEGRFFTPQRELRWQKIRDFQGTLTWHILLAGDWDLQNGFTLEELSESQTVSSFLWHEELPKRFDFQSLGITSPVTLHQKTGLKQGLPFYYQWTHLSQQKQEV
ncbi:hypothetical protein WDW89_12660 [Deltaproteobacteria bacterium TL4]